MSPRSLVSSLALAAFALACSSSSPPGSPGSTPPGGDCTTPDECGCWQCACQGVGGQPGAAQLCIAGTCPTGEAACAPSCAAAGAKVSAATSVGTCVGVP